MNVYGKMAKAKEEMAMKWNGNERRKVNGSMQCARDNDVRKRCAIADRFH